MTVETIRFALRSCSRCGAAFDAYAGARICSECREITKNREKPLNPALSFREMQVAKLVSKAKSNKEIAFELHLTEGTVKEYMNRIFHKTGVSNRVALVLWFMKECPTS